MKVSNVMVSRVSKIVQKYEFVKDILYSIHRLNGRVLLVGGAVRDLFLDVPIKDLDFEVYGLSLDQLQKILENFGQVSLIGKSFGVLRLHGLEVDWSLPRKDSSGRHPRVEYDPYMDYKDAFIRRDLTINAMGLDMQSFEIIDPFGGLQDLQQKILRAPDVQFFQEDPLRLLRVAQFISRFEMQVDSDLTEICKKMDITNLSIERVEQEFKKLFMQGKRPSLGLQWLAKIGKLDQYFPGLHIQKTLCNQLNFASKLSYDNDEEKLIIMYSLMMMHIPSQAIDYNFQEISKIDKIFYASLLQKLVLSDHVRKSIVTCFVYTKISVKPLTDIQVTWLAYWLGQNLSIRLLSKCMIVCFEQDRALQLANQAQRLHVLDRPLEPLITGKDVLDMAQGAQIGELVKIAYQIQLDEQITDKVILKDKTILHSKKICTTF